MNEELGRTRVEAEKAESGRADMASKKLTIEGFLAGFDAMDAYQKNSIMKKLFTECLWDGETLVLKV